VESEVVRQPKPISGVGVAFGDISNLPPMSEIPDQFKKWDGNRWRDLASKWFFKGLGDVDLNPKPGVDADTALRAVGACLRSWEPKHEHKMAGCAYLLSLWFEEPGDWKKTLAP